MDGVQYEQYCKKILEDVGWEVEDTPITEDQGVDLIASIEDLRVCIQCKCFAKAVGNKAVQEVSTGMIHWNGTTKEGHKIDQRVMTLNLGFSYLNMAMVTLL